TVPDDERGAVEQPGPIARLSETPACLTRGAPRLDADGDALRAQPWPARSGSPAGNHAPRTALGDITLLELGTFFAAPHGGTILREFGARVIKVEPIEGGPMRTILPSPEAGPAKSLQGHESIAGGLATAEGE